MIKKIESKCLFLSVRFQNEKIKFEKRNIFKMQHDLKEYMAESIEYCKTISPSRQC